MAWDFRKFGTIGEPIHKSHLTKITGDWGCLKSFKYDMDELAEGKSRESETEVSGKMAAGTAVHETIARAAGNATIMKQLLAGTHKVTAERCQLVYHEEFEKVVGGRDVKWYDDDEDKIASKRALMIAGVLNDLHRHVRSVKFLEAGFIVRIGSYYCSGHTDLVYEPLTVSRDPEVLRYALADWKTGAQRPTQLELDHSWESGIYSAAMKSGLWIAREHVELPEGTPNKYIRERELLDAELIRVARAYEEDGVIEDHVHILGEFPSDIRYVHLPDYVPYEKATSKMIERPEELEFFGMEEKRSRSFKKGDRRGPAWYKVRRTEQDIPRLEALLRNIIGTVRMGRFFENIGDKCAKCSHRQPCLNSGYELRGDSKKILEDKLAEIDIEDDGFGHVA